jgi:hypothetical protein
MGLSTYSAYSRGYHNLRDGNSLGSLEAT